MQMICMICDMPSSFIDEKDACFFACLFFEYVLHHKEIVVPLQCQKKGIKITPTRGGKNSHVH